MLHSNERIIKHKLGLLNLAEELGNVSKARNGPGKLDTAISEISTGFQAAKSGESWLKYTASGVRRSSALCRRRVL